MISFIRNTCIVFIFLFLLSVSTFAAGIIPRDWLRLELMLATGSQDTSGNGRIVSSTGIAPTYQVDPVYGVPYAQFGGSGWLKVNTAWTASGSDDFTVSMWTKIDPSVFDSQYAGYTLYTSPVFVPSANTSRNYTPIRFPTTLLFFKNWELDDNATHLTINSAGKCGIKSTKEFAMITWNAYYWYTDIITDYATIHNSWFVRSGMFTAMQDMFDCAILKDSKWHNLVIRKQSGKLELLIDEKSIGKIISNSTVSRTVSIGNLASFSMDPAIYGHFPQDIQNKIFRNHYFRGWMANIRLYSKALTDDEITVLNDEFRYAQGDLTGAAGIQVTMDKYSKPNLSFYLKNIPLNLAKENVVYQYSFATGSFIDINSTNLNSISSATGSLAYQVNLDISSIPDGKVNLVLRVKNGSVYQNIWTIGFVKNDTVYVININQPDIDNSVSKTISANTNSGWVLYFSTTRGSICDSSITTWDDYTDLIFTSKSDNFIRICYKAVFASANKTIYKISDPIQWINPTNQFTTTSNLFADYALWVKSAYPKPNDSANMILELLGVSSGQSQGTINGITMTDINGDGLVDFLYSRNDAIRRAIIVNNGNYTFKTTYKCAVDVLNSVSTYYWDCADTTR